MTDERYKAIMTELGQPHSHSLLAALRQVANEVAQEEQDRDQECHAGTFPRPVAFDSAAGA